MSRDCRNLQNHLHGGIGAQLHVLEKVAAEIGETELRNIEIANLPAKRLALT